MTNDVMALETRGLGKRYGRTWGLRHCSFGVPPGRIAAVVGPNGAGKSTLLRMAVGLTPASEGEVSVLGSSPHSQSPEFLARIGYLDQERPLYKSFRVHEILRMGRGLNPTWDEELALHYLSELGISLTDRVGPLSIGQQAQVALTVCLAKRPDVLFLDEPVAALDPLARQRLMQVLMGAVVDRATTVVMSTNVLADLENVCDYMIIISSARVVLADDLDHLVSSHRLWRGPDDGVTLPDGAVVVSSIRTGRQRTCLVRTEEPLHDGAGESVEPTLEEIVLAYLRGTGSR